MNKVFKLSPEQEAVVNFNGNCMVNAKAGAGKTSTLVQYAKKRLDKNGLYICYNDSVRKKAKRVFGKNVVCHTAHSLAVSILGQDYPNFGYGIRLENIIDYLRKSTNSFDAGQIQELAMEVLNVIKLFLRKPYKDFKELESVYSKYAVEQAEIIWNKMINNEYQMSFDGILKLLYLMEIDLGYDFVLVDEAQDLNNIMLSIVLNQKSASEKVFVGDDLQSIYSFLGLANIFTKKVDGFEYLEMNTSYRFSKNIAEIATKIIHLRDRKISPVIGGNKNEDRIGFVDKNEPYTIITRGNATIFKEALRLIKEDIKTAIIGGDEMFKEIKNAYYLYLGQLDKVNNKTLKSFGTWENFKKISKKSIDPEYNLMIKVVEEYAEQDILSLLKKIKYGLVNEKMAFVTLTTTHKSKGLEWEQVKMADDFFKVIDPKTGMIKNRFSKKQWEELNILYVTVTRAERVLELNEDLERAVEINFTRSRNF